MLNAGILPNIQNIMQAGATRTKSTGLKMPLFGIPSIHYLTSIFPVVLQFCF